IIPSVAQDTLRQVSRVGKMYVAILSESFAELKPRQVTTVLASSDGGIRPCAGRLQIRAGIWQDEAILGHSLSGVGVNSSAKQCDSFLAGFSVTLEIADLHLQRSEGVVA